MIHSVWYLEVQRRHHSTECDAVFTDVSIAEVGEKGVCVDTFLDSFQLLDKLPVR